jgi:hypothetical protein
MIVFEALDDPDTTNNDYNNINDDKYEIYSNSPKEFIIPKMTISTVNLHPDTNLYSQSTITSPTEHDSDDINTKPSMLNPNPSSSTSSNPSSSTSAYPLTNSNSSTSSSPSPSHDSHTTSSPSPIPTPIPTSLNHSTYTNSSLTTDIDSPKNNDEYVHSNTLCIQVTAGSNPGVAMKWSTISTEAEVSRMFVSVIIAAATKTVIHNSNNNDNINIRNNDICNSRNNNNNDNTDNSNNIHKGDDNNDIDNDITNDDIKKLNDKDFNRNIDDMFQTKENKEHTKINYESRIKCINNAYETSQKVVHILSELLDEFEKNELKYMKNYFNMNNFSFDLKKRNNKNNDNSQINYDIHKIIKKLSKSSPYKKNEHSTIASYLPSFDFIEFSLFFLNIYDGEQWKKN